LLGDDMKGGICHVS